MALATACAASTENWFKTGAASDATATDCLRCMGACSAATAKTLLSSATFADLAAAATATSGTATEGNALASNTNWGER
jgi:hypothetical protein